MTLSISDDARLLAGAVGGIVLVFGLIGGFLGYDLSGILNMLARITLLATVYAMLALALNLQWGYTGLFNIGVAGFMAVGVYTMAILTASPSASEPGLGLPLWVGIPVGVAVAGILGVIIAFPALRLRADYLAIVTLGFSEIIRVTLQSGWLDSTLESTVGVATGAGGGIALSQNPASAVEGLLLTDGDPTALGTLLFSLTDQIGITRAVIIEWVYIISLLLILAGLYWLMQRLCDSPFGRLIKSIREDELAAQTLGKRTQWAKIRVFALGCAIMGLVGILWQGSTGVTSPDSFLPRITFYAFIALFLGGSGSNTGSVLGGFVFVAALFEGPTYVPRIIDRGLELLGYSLPSTPSTFVEAVAAFGHFDPLLFVAYANANIEALRFVIVGVALILLLQRRPTGVLGNRLNVASSIDLTDCRAEESSSSE